MVDLLHAQAYELLRVVHGMSPSGMHYRCSVVPTSNISPAHGASPRESRLAAHYSTASERHFLDWNDAENDTVEGLAEKFIARFPEIMILGSGRDPAYIAWYQLLLEFVERHEFPIAYEDGYFNRSAKSATKSMPTISCYESALPLPPPISFEP